LRRYYVILFQDNFEGWDEADWGWKDEGSDDAASEKDTVSLAWLQDCHVHLSPAGDLLALAKESRLVLLERTYIYRI